MTLFLRASDETDCCLGYAPDDKVIRGERTLKNKTRQFNTINNLKTVENAVCLHYVLMRTKTIQSL